MSGDHESNRSQNRGETSTNSKENTTTSVGCNGIDVAFWELDSGVKLNVWIEKKLSVAVKDVMLSDTEAPKELIKSLYNNLVKSIASLKVVDAPAELKDPDDTSDDDSEYDAGAKMESEKESSSGSRRSGNLRKPRRKRHKPIKRLLQDPYGIWFQLSDSQNDSILNKNGGYAQSDVWKRGIIFWREDQDEIPDNFGGRLSVLSIGGFLNALVAIPATMDPHNPNIQITRPGLCHTTLPNAKALTKLVKANQYLAQALAALGGRSMATVSQLHAIALQLHQAVVDQVKLDILQTTPGRIQQMLASDLTPTEFASVRKRVYDTVILGKGMGNATNDEEDLKEVPTASSAQGVHDIEKFKKCPTCGNNEQSEFILDRKNGDVICSNCGTVVSESLMHEGSQYRKFEGEVDRNHHGDAANPLYSNAHNMSTSLSGIQPTSGAGIGGWGSGGLGGKRNLETILKNAHAFTELNVSQFGKTDRRTRVGYKDRQKKDAFLQMTHAGDALNLHEAVVQRAKELFAGFRDDRELIQQFKGVLAACLCEAFEQLSAEGKNLLKQQQSQQEQQDQIRNDRQSPSVILGGDNDGDDEVNGTDRVKHNVSARANRRNELHHAKLAGKGGLLLNTAAVAETITPPTIVQSGVAATEDGEAEKPAAAWDLEDCRTWLLEASRRIAQAWVDEREKDASSARSYPTAPKEELEGQLVEHAITLSEHLEVEWRSRTNNSSSSSSLATAKKKVVTPRVNDMTKLGIKWQHAHERGSGGKGGVGNNAQSAAPQGKALPTTGGSVVAVPSRTAGQILLLKTAQKLGAILKDKTAGEAFHKELRAVIGRQEERKQKALRNEATRQRFHQMQRKPWLQARVQQEE